MTNQNSALVVASSNMKSWALGLNYAVELAGQGFHVTFLDTTKMSSFLPRSRKSREFQKKICFQNNITYAATKRLDFIFSNDFYIFLKLAVVLRLSKRIFFQLTEKRYSFLSLSILSRLAQTMGSRDFPLKEVPFGPTLRFLYFAILGRAIPNNHSFSRCKMVVIFNGRDTLEANVIRGFLDRKIPIRILERVFKSDRFEVYSTSPHFHPEWWEKILHFSHQNFDESQEIEAQVFLEDKMHGTNSSNGTKWLRYYESTFNPLELDQNFVLFFATSTHEFSPISEYNSNLGYSDQRDAILALLEICNECEVPLIIKRHPNSLSPFNECDYEDGFWKEFKDRKVCIVGPRERIDTHELAKKSRVCFVWRSSLGLETAALGVPTYALGTARWATTSDSRTWTIADIRTAISQPSMPSRKMVLDYTRYMALGGKKLSIFESVAKESCVTLDGDSFSLFEFNLNNRISRRFRKTLGKNYRKY